MIKRIKNRILYKKRVRLLKVYAVNTLVTLTINNGEFINGFQKLLLALNDTKTNTEVNNMLLDYLKTIKDNKKNR